MFSDFINYLTSTPLTLSNYLILCVWFISFCCVNLHSDYRRWVRWHKTTRTVNALLVIFLVIFPLISFLGDAYIDHPAWLVKLIPANACFDALIALIWCFNSHVMEGFDRKYEKRLNQEMKKKMWEAMGQSIWKKAERLQS